MKTVKLTVLFLFFPLVFFAQTLTGLWIGSVSNDSATVRKDQSFEIVLTQYKDKVYGYSRSTFIVNDTLFYIVKRVKGTIENNVCEVKDDEIVSYNFHGRLDKGVKMITTFHFDDGDSTWRMDGDWKTNKTKKYYSLSGKATLNQEKDLSKSKIFPHLEELKLADDVAFYKESKKATEQIAAIKQPEKDNKKEGVAKTDKLLVVQPTEIKTMVTQTKQATEATKKQPTATMADQKIATIGENNNKDNSATVQPGSVVQTKPPAIVKQENKIPQVKSEPVAQIKQPVNNLKNEQATIEEKKAAVPVEHHKDSVVLAQARSNPATQTNQHANDPKKPVVVKEEKAPELRKQEPVAITKPSDQKKETIFESSKPESTNKESIAATITTKETNKQQPVSAVPENKPEIPAAAVFVAERKIAAPQVVSFKSDSLLLSLYDNGEVDGDTVSVLLNGEVIIAKQELKVSAIKKTIYVPAGKEDSFTLVLYAENLGKYPPNTGLLIVHDGDDTYQIRFTADLQQNAAVIFKRKRN
jgi:hypothetical protein